MSRISRHYDSRISKPMHERANLRISLTTRYTPRLKAEIINKYLPVIETWPEPQLVTLTAKSCYAKNLRNENRLIYTRISKTSPTIKTSLYLKLKFYGSEINQHTYQSFLNVARLSALALSVYLAALKIENRRLGNWNHKFLFLDDIFIGLDTSNRIPLTDNPIFSNSRCELKTPTPDTK